MSLKALGKAWCFLFSFPAPYPAPFDSTHFLPSFEFQHGLSRAKRSRARWKRQHCRLQQCWIRLHSSSNIFGPRTRIAHGLQSLMGCILSTIHCSSQRCWELLHCLHTTTIPDATTARKELHINNDLEVVHPLSGSSSTWFLVELEFENVGFWGEEKTRVLGVQERTNNELNQHGLDAGIKCQRSTKRKNKLYKHNKEMLKGRREVCTFSKKVRTPVQQQSATKLG